MNDTGIRRVFSWQRLFSSARSLRLGEVWLALALVLLASMVDCSTSSSSAPTPEPPVILGFAPGFLPAGASGQTVTMVGERFLSGAAVSFNGLPRAATLVDATQITFSLTPSDLATVGSFPVVVSNPGNGGSSTEATFPVTPAAELSNLFPAAIQAGSPGQVLAVNGAYFTPDCLLALDGAVRATTFESPTRLTMALADSDLASVAPHAVSVSTLGAAPIRALSLQVVATLPPAGFLVTRQRTEYRSNPLGIDCSAPRMEWTFTSALRNQWQSAYRLLVASSQANLDGNLGDLWDSGKVASAASTQVAYAGKPLASRQRAFWKVMAWDGNDVATGWSATATWEMGLLDLDDWQGRWITAPAASTAGGGPARYLRRSFTVAKPVSQARLYATALGLYQASLNGQPASGLRFAPGFTDYGKRVQVQTYDVTAGLTQGENVLGLVLGDGWFQGKVGYLGRGVFGPGPIRALAQLEIQYADGTSDTIGSDTSWSASTNGPIRFSDLMDGETYDAQLELPGWNAPGFGAPGWVPAVFADSHPPLVAQPDDGMVVEGDRPALTVNEVTPGVLIYDLGQNISGWVRLQVQGPAGAHLVLHHGEVLNPDGTLYTANLRGAAATDQYVLKGSGATEVWEPLFTIHGFRYVSLSGDLGVLTVKPGLAAVTGVVAHAALAETGTLVTSDSGLNQLQSNIVWTQKDNFTAIPTDCPQRDERLGWMGDAQVFAPTAALNMGVAAFFTKWLRDVDDAQRADGAFQDFSPMPALAQGEGTPAWGDAGVIVPWKMYLAYGDLRVLAEHYLAMTRWISYIESANANGLWVQSRGGDYGDWLSVNADTDNEVLATAYYAHSVDLLSRIATLLGQSEDAARYAELFASIKAAFIATYVGADGQVRSNTQAVYALALRFGLLPCARRPLTVALLQADLVAHGGYLTTGFLGVGQLLPALSDAGLSDTAYQLIDNSGFPSWRYEINRGATTTWEHWDSILPSGAFNDPSMNSFNHYAFGAVGEWMYSTIAGLELDEQQPGWKSFNLRPRPGGGLSSAQATLDTAYGTIVSAWTLAGGVFTLRIQVPVNTQARVFLPYLGNASLDGAPVGPIGADGGLALGSGTYTFTSNGGN